MGRIEVNGDVFDVQRWARWKSDTVFVLNIQVADRKGLPNHIFNRVLTPGGRKDLTDDYVEAELNKWAEHHPDMDITGFGITEEMTARVGAPPGELD